MISYAARSAEKKFIIGTEAGILHPLSKANPEKIFIVAGPDMVCKDMKKIGLMDILGALENLKPEIKVSEEISTNAKKAVNRMLAIPK